MEGSDMTTVSHGTQSSSVLSALGSDELGLLEALRNAGRMSVSALAAAAGLSVARAREVSAQLEAHHLVHRVPDEDGDSVELDYDGLQSVVEDGGKTSAPTGVSSQLDAKRQSA
jgi:hypothetical protein